MILSGATLPQIQQVIGESAISSQSTLNRRGIPPPSNDQISQRSQVSQPAIEITPQSIQQIREEYRRVYEKSQSFLKAFSSLCVVNKKLQEENIQLKAIIQEKKNEIVQLQQDYTANKDNWIKQIQCLNQEKDKLISQNLANLTLQRQKRPYFDDRRGKSDPLPSNESPKIKGLELENQKLRDLLSKAKQEKQNDEEEKKVMMKQLTKAWRTIQDFQKKDNNPELKKENSNINIVMVGQAHSESLDKKPSTPSSLMKNIYYDLRQP